jgi:hypothetical protein
MVLEDLIFRRRFYLVPVPCLWGSGVANLMELLSLESFTEAVTVPHYLSTLLQVKYPTVQQLNSLLPLPLNFLQLP